MFFRSLEKLLIDSYLIVSSREKKRKRETRTWLKSLWHDGKWISDVGEAGLRIISLIEAYVASHFGRFAFEMVPRRSGYLTSHDLRAQSRAGRSHAIGPYVFSNALRALQQARLSRRWAAVRVGELRRLAGMQVCARYSSRMYVCTHMYGIAIWDRKVFMPIEKEIITRANSEKN